MGQVCEKRGTPVIADDAQPDVMYTLVGTAGGNDPDTGDIYRGLDRFGRVKDAYWRDYGASADARRGTIGSPGSARYDCRG